MTEFWHDLQCQVHGMLKTDRYSRILYSTDASSYQVVPLGVFFPKHADDIQIAIETAAKYHVPILMHGAGSSLAGQTVNEALVIDTSRHLNRILEVNQDEKWVHVEVGAILDNLNIHLKPMGLQFGPDPASGNRATMGGIVANNSTGAHSIVYGMTADHVLGMNCVLSDGKRATFFDMQVKLTDSFSLLHNELANIMAINKTIIRNSTPKHWRRCGGYNLDRMLDFDRFNIAKLISGSEGTLAAITDVTLNLVDCPKATGLGIVHFEHQHEALSAIPLLLETQPSAIEIMAELALRVCQQVPEYARLLTFLISESKSTTLGDVLIIEYTGENELEIKSKLKNLDQFLKIHHIGTACVHAITKKEQANVWEVRKAGLGLLMSVKGDYKPITLIEDCAVPVEHLAEYVGHVEQICHDLAVEIVYHAHASAGCLHIRPFINLKDAKQIEAMKTISESVMELVTNYGGAWSSEHGDGRARSWLNERFFGTELYHVFEQVKYLFDPDNIMNPGNIVNANPIDENLRYGKTYAVMPINEHLDFSRTDGFHGAVEMCNGAGACRKEHGTMCPSYMVTKDEEHSTRGRANLLRAALSGKLPHAEFSSKRMYQVMDLCVECKGCKSECASSVDMAKIKTEFLAHYYDKHGIPLRTRLFGKIAVLNRLCSGKLAPLANRILQNYAVRMAMKMTLGIESRRDMPPFAPESFITWFYNRPMPIVQNPKNMVVLFTDTFNTYNYPHVAIAATEVLESLGFKVILSEHGCCGRPSISKGLIEQARNYARKTVAKLAPYAKHGIPIIGLEPSCILSVRDEYLYFLADNDEVKMVADMCFTFEEFVADLDLTGFKNLSGLPFEKIILHGHCHQKALVGMEPAMKVLSLLGCPIEVIDSGCCGMAGAFGYESEHYSISMAMAERTLLPAIRSADDKTLVVTSGVSCRQQIMHGTGKSVFHPAEVLHMAGAKKLAFLCQSKL